MNRYDYLSLIAMVAVPLAPAFFFGHAVYTAVAALPAAVWMAVIVGVMAALGLELVGILAGHVTNTAWHLGDYGRAVLGALIMVVYVVIGIAELWGSIGAVMFLIAPLVYLLAALQDGLHTAVIRQEAETAVAHQQAQEERRQQLEHEQRMELDAQEERRQQLAHQQRLEAAVREERRQQLEHQQRMDAERLRLAHEEKLARITAKSAPEGRQLARQDSGNLRSNLPQDWRQLTVQQRHDLAHLSREEREGIIPKELAERTRREWHLRLDEIAVQNGSYAG